MLLRQYARKFDHESRGLLTGSGIPLAPASSEPLASIYRSVNSYAHLVPAGIDLGSPGHTTDAELRSGPAPFSTASIARISTQWKATFAAREKRIARSPTSPMPPGPRRSAPSFRR